MRAFRDGAVTRDGRFAAQNAVGTGGWSEEELEQMMPKIAAPQPPELISESAENALPVGGLPAE